MNNEKEPLEVEIEQAIQLFAERCGILLADTLRPIILANLKKGRVDYFLDDGSSRSPIDYVYSVAGYYEQWHTYLQHIQKEKRPELWQPLYEKLQRLAYRYLLKRNFSGPEIMRLQLHIDCAIEAAERLLRASFSYDTAFDPWVTILVQRSVDRRLGELFKQTQLEAEPVAAEQLDDWWHLLADPESASAQERIELLDDLLWAIGQLPSEAQKQVIILRYLKHRSYPEIAVQLDKTIRAVHKLHHDAMNNLRKILANSKDRYK